MNKPIKTQIFKILACSALLALFFSLRATGLTSDISDADSARWHKRSLAFLTALKGQNFSQTFQHNQPGVSLMWIGALYEQTFHPQGTNLEDYNSYIDIHRESRLVLISVFSLLFLIQLILINKFFDFKTAFFYGLFLACEPYLIGIDKYFHVTSLETYFLFTSFLCLLLWNKVKKNSYLIPSAIFYALALLTKSSVVVLLPLYAAIFILNFKNKKLSSITFLLISLSVYFALFPALWVNFSTIISKLYGGISNAISEDTRSITYNYILSFFYYPILLAFKLSPITFILFVLAMIKLKSIEELKKHWHLILYLILYYAAYSIAVKKIDRYIIVIYPPLILLISQYMGELSIKYKKIIIFVTLLFTIWHAYIYFPVFSAYYSPLFGGTSMAMKADVYTNSGQYFAQAATYLNNNYSKKDTYVPYNKETFYYFFRDKPYMVDRVNKNTDFIVVSINKLSNKSLIPERCLNIKASFGSKELQIVNIYECQKSK